MRWAPALVIAGCGCRYGFGHGDDAGAGDDGNGQEAPIDAALPNLMFTTSTTHRGLDVTTTAMADSICEMRAGEAGLSGTYRAWWSSTTEDALTRISIARGWTRTDGRPFADRIEDAMLPLGGMAGRVYSPALLDENGQPVTNVGVMTATDGNGKHSTNDCSGGNIDGGYTYSTYKWMSNVSMPCTSAAHLLCFGIDRDLPLVTSPPAGRRAFMVSFTTSGTLADADTACQTAAMSAGYVGSFKAWLATTTATASSRFSATGGPWIRPDGITLADDAASVLAGTLESPLNVMPNGTYIGPYKVFSGAADPVTVGTPATTCTNWTATGTVVAGDPHSVTATAFSTGSYPCNQGGYLYCLQE